MMEQYQVTELTQLLKNMVEHAFPGLIMVHGEITGFSKASSGHIYFTLKDEGARLKAAYFRQSQHREAFIPKNGDKVSAIGELRVYEGDGSYQLIVRKVIYNKEGEFWQKFEETKRKLEAMGAFDPAAKRKVPVFPKRVALLTAATGAAVRDFAITAKKAGYFFQIDVWPIPVQGKDAAAPIVAALEKAGRLTTVYDVLVLSRGGGSLDDLAVFNDEKVALALKASAVPTVSAIGHEQDVSICDMVADLRVATPTAAAEKLSEAYKEAAIKAERLHTRLARTLQLRLENAIMDADRLNARLHAAGTRSSVEKARLVLDNRVERVYNAMRNVFAEPKSKLDRLSSKLEILSPKRTIDEYAAKLPVMGSRLSAVMAKTLTEQKHRLEINSQRLETVNPEAFLSMGYALVMKDGVVLKDIENVHLNDELDIKIKGGQLAAFVTGKRMDTA